ncbi:MAG: phosphoesterase [Staphylothermus sp.]|nr:phosphoesterase [Staphylothermus sp.]
MCKWVLLVHGDSDGVCSGALAYHYYTFVNGCNVKVYFTHPAGLANDLLEFTSNGDNVFIADIALCEKSIEVIRDILKERSKYGSVVYIDHHPAPLGLHPMDLSGEIIHDTCCSASELAYKYFHERELGDEYSRITLFGAIGDYLDNTEWVNRVLNDWDKRHVFFEAGLLIQALESSRREYDFKRRIVKYLAHNNLPSNDSELVLRAIIQSHRDEELRLWVRKNVIKKYKFLSLVVNPPGSLGRAATYARVYGFSPVGIAYEIRNDIVVMSLRGNGSVDLNMVLRKLCKKINCSGGGHPNAAGARVEIGKLDIFFELLDKIIEDYSRNKFSYCKNN